MRPSSIALVGITKLLVGAYPRWMGCTADSVQRIYFANHTSHIDTLAIWAALPMRLRLHTHPVAALDYWGQGFRRYMATRALRAILIDRARDTRTTDPLEPLIQALSEGKSLILFPEGTRSHSATPSAFKSGLYRLASAFAQVQLVPVYLENLHRSLPKGAFLPIPMTCTVRFGTPLQLVPDETKEAFLERARGEVMRLAGRAGAAP